MRYPVNYYILFVLLIDVNLTHSQNINQKIKDYFIPVYKKALNDKNFMLLKPYLSTKLTIAPWPENASIQYLKSMLSEDFFEVKEIKALNVTNVESSNKHIHALIEHRFEFGDKIIVDATFIWDNDTLKVLSLSDKFNGIFHTTGRVVAYSYTFIDGELKLDTSRVNAKEKEMEEKRYNDTTRWKTDYGSENEPAFLIKDNDTINTIDQNGLLQGEWERLYPDGSFKCAGVYKDGKKEGYWERKYENHNWRYQVNMKDGYQDGYCKHYYENGNIKIEGNYKMGKKHGLIKIHYENGKLQSEEFFEDAVLNGICKYYDEKGILKRQGEFKSGEMNGVWTYYTHEGKPQVKITLDMGKTLKTETIEE